MRISEKFLHPAALAALFCTLLPGTGAYAADDVDALLRQAASGGHREAANVARDAYRHPVETLEFLGLRPDMTVVEIWPARGWYTELLAPVLRAHGQLYEASFSPEHETQAYRKEIQKAFLDKLAAHPEIYDRVKVTALKYPEETDIAPAGSADMVLTFRNVHNWLHAGHMDEMFAIFFRTLKAGGVLGVVEHRAKPGTSVEQMESTGYMAEDAVIAAAQKAGFVLEAKSEINANPKDDTNHESGVWTLPPTFAACRKIEDADAMAACREKYAAIGESDRMTLRFRKPPG